jgi:hypothetical protein
MRRWIVDEGRALWTEFTLWAEEQLRITAAEPGRDTMLK